MNPIFAQRLLDRLQAQMVPQSNGCIWLTTKPDAEGYSRTSIQNRSHRAHRVIYELLVGPIPDGMTIDHTCHDPSECQPGPTCPHRRCVNPEHLEVVSSVENIARGGSFSSENAAKTHCVHGHEFTPENTYRPPLTSRRQCRACIRAAGKRYRESRGR